MKDELDECFLCGETSKVIDGQCVALDKRDRGDGLMGEVFICHDCYNDTEARYK